MAVGDVINGIGTAGADLTFTPAAGVEIIITSIGAYGNWLSMKSATLKSLIMTPGPAGAVTGFNGNANTKFAINNTNYLLLEAPSIGTISASYSGIQIK
tara:strand:- start:362 stop:658 length:297 start_codon:yes stop_codon:yes gene_type:complete